MIPSSLVCHMLSEQHSHSLPQSSSSAHKSSNSPGSCSGCCSTSGFASVLFAASSFPKWRSRISNKARVSPLRSVMLRIPVSYVELRRFVVPLHQIDLFGPACLRLAQNPHVLSDVKSDLLRSVNLSWHFYPFQISLCKYILTSL